MYEKKKINKNVKKKNPTTSISIYDFEIHYKLQHKWF